MATYRVDGETHQGLKISQDFEAPNEEEAVKYAGFVVSKVRLVQNAQPDERKKHQGDFPGLNTAGGVLKFFGCFVILSSFIAVAFLIANSITVEDSTSILLYLLLGLYGFVGGIFVYATGEACQALRVIAINSYQ